MSVTGATVPGMSTTPDLFPHPPLAATNPAAHAGAGAAREMVARAVGELPALAELAPGSGCWPRRG